jgi:uncharacterized RDD family membrane protein YckC
MSAAAGPSGPEISPQLSTIRAYAGEPGAIEGVAFWPRVGARLIDLVIHYIVGILVGFFFAVVVLIAAAGHPDPIQLARMRHTGIAVFVFSLLGSVVYEIICEGLHGSTLGKLVLGMCVVQEDGAPCRFSSALIRSLAYLVDALFFGLIGYMAMQGSPQMQRKGDEWAHTIVCRRSAIPVETLRSGGRFILAFRCALMADAALIMVGSVLNLTA